MNNNTYKRLVAFGLPFDNPNRVSVPVRKLGKFVRGYLEAQLAITDHSVFDGGGPLSGTHTIDDYTERTLAQIARDLGYFLYWQLETVLSVQDDYPEAYSDFDVGWDLYLSRRYNENLLGFYDRGFDDRWADLHHFAWKMYKPQEVWVNADGEVDTIFNYKGA